jgi:hypothetical protein
MHICSSSFRRVFSGIFAVLLILSLPQTLKAQDPTEALGAVRQANARLVAGVRNGSATTADTRATLTARFAQLETVIRTTPALARSYALDATTRSALLKADPSYAALLERDVPQTGELTAVIGDDFTNHAANTHYMLHTMTADISLSFTTDHGTSLDRMLHHQVTVTGVGLPDVVAAETIREASPVEIQNCAVPTGTSVSLPRLSGPLSGDLASQVKAAVINPGAATAACSTFGNQTTAILILNFAGGTATYPGNYGTQAYWNTLFNGADPSVANLVKEASYGQTTAAADVYGPITVPGVFDCATTDAMTAAAFTAATGTVDFTKYNRYILVFPSTTCNFGGLDTLGCLGATATVPNQYSVMWMPIPQTYTATFPTTLYAGVGHEYGHALGLNHSNSLDFGALSLGPLDYTSANPGTVFGAAGGATTNAPATTAAAPAGSTTIGAINTEYGDNYAGMGNPWSPAGPFAGQHKAQVLGWIPPASAQVVTTSGTYSVAPVETTTGVRTLQVLRDATSSSWVWIEYHQPLGVYEPLSLAALQTNNLTTGAELHYQDGLGKPLYTLLMNMAPTAAPNNFFNSNLTPGASWSDPFSLLTITAGTQTPTSMPLTISYDTPCATVALNSATLPATAGTGFVNITAPSTCNWSVSSNATWISFPGATTGTGNSIVSFNYAANTAAAQRNSYITAQRQSLPVVQSGTSISVLTASPNNAVMAPSVMTAYTFTITDPLGAAADFAQFNVNFVGGTNPDCAVTVNANGTGTTGDMTLTQGTTVSTVLTTGNTGTISNSSCTLDGPGSSFAINGNTVTITLGISFPAAFLGVHPIMASAAGATAFSTTVPLGYVNVANITAVTPGVTIAPGFGNQGTTVPITLTGTNTSFSGTSVVSLVGPGGTANGITVTGTTAASATSLTASLVIPAAATAGPYTITVTTGAQVVTAPFTVNVPPAPTVTIAPATGDQGATVPFTITGINTNFSAATTVTGGTGMTATGLTAVNATTLTGSFVIGAAAATGPQTVTVTSGTQVSTTTFTVNAVAAPSIVIAPASANMGTTVPVTIIGTNTTFLPGSTIAISGADVTATNVTFGTAASLTANIVIANTADAGPRTVTVTSGAEVDTAIFTVLVAPTPRVTISPATGATGSTAQVTITGVNTNFSVATTITVSGTGITVANVAGRDAGFLSANFVIAPTAAPGPYTVTITSGTQVVTTTFTVQAMTATTSVLSASAASIVPGQTLNLKAVVTANSGGGTPGGLVSFYDLLSTSPQPIMRGTVNLSAGTVTLPLTGLSLGTHTFSLQYIGDNVTYAPSASATSITVTVAQAAPGVTLTGVPTGTVFPAAAAGLSFSSVVSGGTTGITPIGSVSFMDGATLLSKVNLTAGTATLNGVTLAAGTHSITATYNGDTNFSTFTTTPQAVAVQDFTIAANPGTLTFTGSESLSSTLTITPLTGGFTQSIALSCSGAPANSLCSVSTPAVTPGTTAATALVYVITTARPSVITSKTGVAMLLFGSISGLFLFRRRRKLLSIVLMMIAAAGLAMSSGCNSGTPIPTIGSGTAAGTYTITITGTATGATTLTHTTTVTAVVN